VALFGRVPDVAVTVAPGVVLPRQIVTATVTASAPVDRVRSVTLDWGYNNFYRYHWAGHVDSAAAAVNDNLLTIGEVGTNYGGDRETDDWVSVTRVELPIAIDEFTGGSAQFKIPSWAPASSSELVRWSCRLKIERDGRDVQEDGEFTVIISRHNVEDVPEPLERYAGSGEAELNIVLPSSVFAAGEVIRGHIDVIPVRDLPDGDLAVYCQRHRESHPLTRRPCKTAPLDGRIVQLNKGIPLRSGSPFSIPFELPLPSDAAPTAAAVHSSISWSVAARLFYAGFSGPMTERVRRGITVVSGTLN
jgi:hypothetical protein